VLVAAAIFTWIVLAVGTCEPFFVVRSRGGDRRLLAFWILDGHRFHHRHHHHRSFPFVFPFYSQKCGLVKKQYPPFPMLKSMHQLSCERRQHRHSLQELDAGSGSSVINRSERVNSVKIIWLRFQADHENLISS
jgi:hypothetical protein